jgi:hypothetical protein
MICPDGFAEDKNQLPRVIENISVAKQHRRRGQEKEKGIVG